MSYPPQPPLPQNPPVVKRRANIENKRSLLLSAEENQCIFDILGKGRQTLATAVAQVLVPTSDQQTWQVKDTGVVCFVRDTTKRSYYIQMFSLRTKAMVFRQEIYTQFEYKMPLPWFLTFEGDSQMVGINFADRVEAVSYKEALDNKLESRRQRKARNSRNFDNINSNSNATQHLQNNNVNMVHSNSNLPHKYPNGNSTSSVSVGYQAPVKKEIKKGKSKDKDKKKSLRKEDIGIPMDFRHVQHVGWDPNRGFDLDGVDQDFQTFFEKAGISHNELEDEGTRRFIYDFIENHGGVEAVKRSVSHAPPPPPPISSSNSDPPPVPTRHPSYPSIPGIGKPAAPPPPNRPVPPPPPPSRTASNHLQQPLSRPNNIGAPNPPQNFAPPPPPPPPPCLPPPASNGDISGGEVESGFVIGHSKQPPPVVEDDRSALMKQIQRGVSLKKIDPDQVAKKSSGTLADCLNQIKTGVDLKKVPENVKPPPQLEGMDGLAGALARALAERSKAINPESSSSDDDDGDAYDEDEWE